MLETKTRRLLIIKEQGGKKFRRKKQNAALHSLNGCIVKSWNLSTMERWSGRPTKSRHSPFSPFLCPSASSQICTTLLFLFPFLYVQGTVPFSTFTLNYIWWPFEPPQCLAHKRCSLCEQEGRAHALSFNVLCGVTASLAFLVFSFWCFFFETSWVLFSVKLTALQVCQFSPRPFTSPSPVSPTSWGHGWILPDVSFQKHSWLFPSSLWCIASQARRILTSLQAHFPHDDF